MNKYGLIALLTLVSLGTLYGQVVSAAPGQTATTGELTLSVTTSDPCKILGPALGCATPETTVFVTVTAPSSCTVTVTAGSTILNRHITEGTETLVFEVPEMSGPIVVTAVANPEKVKVRK